MYVCVCVCMVSKSGGGWGSEGRWGRNVEMARVVVADYALDVHPLAKCWPQLRTFRLLLATHGQTDGHTKLCCFDGLAAPCCCSAVGSRLHSTPSLLLLPPAMWCSTSVVCWLRGLAPSGHKGGRLPDIPLMETVL